MAVIACDRRVRAIETKIRLRIVVKQPKVPVDRVMTQPTFSAKPILMRVVFSVTRYTFYFCLLEFVRLVTILAFRIRMSAEQREICQTMVEPHTIGPGHIVMTVIATLTLFRLVRVVVAVAGNAGGVQRDVEDRLYMTLYARDRKVRSFELVLGIPVVIECDRRPVLGNMAVIALLTEMALMIVFLEVTRNAGDFQRVRERILAMTIITSKTHMAAVQRKLGVTVMIETRVVPIRRIVAIFAVFSASSVVGIILLVASEAGRRRQSESVVRMAIQTSDFLVLAEQRVIGRVVVEFDLLPISRRMAVSTCLTKVALVHIIVTVAINAQTGRLAEFLAVFVAVRAFHVDMLAIEMKVGHIVVKGFFLQHDDNRIPSFMFRVTGLALLALHFRKQSVKAHYLLDIGRNIFVTFDTLRILALLLERSMARRTFPLDIGMPLDHLARHNQFLYFNCLCRRKSELCQHDCNTY